MSKSLRNNIAAATAALCPASFAAYLWLDSVYFSSHPSVPNTDLGFVYALNHHGANAYISSTESTGLALLLMAFLLGFLVTLIIVPKEPILPPSGTPKWITFVSGRARTGFSNPTRQMKAIFVCSIASCLAVIYLLGPSIAGVLVSRGIVLHV
jgi:hypothetical protein